MKNKNNTSNENPYPVGKPVFIRTVTMNYTGKLVACNPGELVLEDAAWIADMGIRMSEFLKGQSKFNSDTEVEPFLHSVIIPRNAIIDITEWEGDLPKEPRG
jgi:hypothetical protein